MALSRFISFRKHLTTLSNFINFRKKEITVPNPTKINLTDNLARQLASWATGLSSEVNFWEQWIATSGGQWPDEYAARMSGKRQFDVNLDNQYIPHIKVLDVGAGPVSSLGSVRANGSISVVAIDPLAAYYQALLAAAGVTPPVRTQTGFAEDLSAQFDLGHFDVVHCQNALDHSFDPLRAIYEMLHVCKLSGLIVLSHNQNEALNENYVGLHQWNITCEGGNLIIWNPEYTYNVSDLLADVADIDVKITGNYIRAEITPRRRNLIDLGHYHRARIYDLLQAFVYVNGTLK